VLPTAGTATGNKVSTISATSPGWASFSIMLLPPYDPTVTLTWTATTDTWATGYEVARSPGSTTSVSGQSTTTWTDTTTAAATGYTYTIKSVYGTWRSTPQAATVAHC
jgi:hypothetical protein